MPKSYELEFAPELWVASSAMPHGDDDGPGTEAKPLRTIEEAFERLAAGTPQGPVRLRLHRGVHAVLEDEAYWRVPGVAGTDSHPVVIEGGWEPAPGAPSVLTVAGGASAGAVGMGDPVFASVPLAGAPALSPGAHAGHRARFTKGVLAGQSFALADNAAAALTPVGALPATPVAGDELVLERPAAVVQLRTALSITPGTGSLLGVRGVEFVSPVASAMLVLGPGLHAAFSGCRFAGAGELYVVVQGGRAAFGGYAVADLLPREVYRPDSGDGYAALGCAFVAAGRTLPSVAYGGTASIELSVLRGARVQVDDGARLYVSRAALQSGAAATDVTVEGGRLQLFGVRASGAQLANPVVRVLRGGRAGIEATRIDGASGTAVLARDGAQVSLDHVYGAGNAGWGCELQAGAFAVADPATVAIAGSAGQLRLGARPGSVAWNTLAGLQTDLGYADSQLVAVRAGKAI